MLKAKNYFEFSGEGGIQGCLLLALLMDSSKTLSIDAFVTLDKEIREDCRCGWKDISRDVPFSQLTMPQKKSPPSSRKRNKSEKYSTEELGIVEKLSRTKQETLEKQVQ